MKKNELYHHGVLGQKWGVRRYQNRDGTLTALGKRHKQENFEAKRLVDDIHAIAESKRPKINKDVISAVHKTGAQMYGLKYELKTKESLTRKILKDSIEKDISLIDAANGIRDAVRYTAVSSDNRFTKNYFDIKKDLESKGYTETRCKNYFEMYKQGLVKHKSVQSIFQDKDGYQFELQFQTPASQDAKNKKVPIYEESRKVGITEKRKNQLIRQMEDLADHVPDPKDISLIKSH